MVTCHYWCCWIIGGLPCCPHHCFHSWQPVSDHLLSARLTHRHGCILHVTGLSHTETWSSCAARWLQCWDSRVERWIRTHPWHIWLTTILHGSSLFVHNLSINVSAEAYSSLCMEVTSKETELLVNAGCSQCVGCIDDLNVQEIQIIVAKARFAFVTPPKTPLWRGPSEWPMLKHEYVVYVSTKFQTAAASHPEDNIQLEWSNFCMAIHLVQMKSDKRDTSVTVTCLISSRPYQAGSPPSRHVLPALRLICQTLSMITHHHVLWDHPINWYSQYLAWH